MHQQVTSEDVLPLSIQALRQQWVVCRKACGKWRSYAPVLVRTDTPCTHDWQLTMGWGGCMACSPVVVGAAARHRG
jgi:hypothetical protein